MYCHKQMPDEEDRDSSRSEEMWAVSQRMAGSAFATAKASTTVSSKY